MKLSQKISIAVLLVTFFACSSFKYKYYGIYPSKGLILGKEPKDDLPITVCEPDEQSKGKCVVVFVDEFERMRADMIELQTRLTACEQGHK